MEIDSKERKAVVLPSALLAQEDDACKVFSFSTPKSSRRMLLKALSCTPQSATPKRTARSTTEKRSCARKHVNSHKCKESREEDEDDDSLVELEKLSVVDNGDDDDDDDDDNDDDKENHSKNELRKLRSAVEDYFEVHSGAGGKSGPNTSNRTLSRLGQSRPDLETVRRLLAAHQSSQCAASKGIIKRLQAEFPRWMEELLVGFNILLHGLGSKRQLLSDFSRKSLSNFACVEVFGFHPSCSLQQVLLALSDTLLNGISFSRQPHELLQRLLQELNREELADVYLIVHNIDGPLLRSHKVQDALSCLASTKRLRILASVDHVNAALLWSEAAMARFSWLWKHVSTLQAYTEETSFENSLMSQSGGALQLASMQRVMMSLTPNAKGVFLLLARQQVTQDTNSQGFLLEDLYRQCRDAFLVTSELNLHAQLTEFRDHKLVRLKKGLDGAEFIIIPLDSNTLTEFLREYEDYSY